MYRSHQDSTAWIATKVRPLIGLVALRGAGDILGHDIHYETHIHLATFAHELHFQEILFAFRAGFWTASL